jgi:hypothetical protein
MRRGQWHPTISTRVRNRDGLVSWLKVACMSKEDAWFQAGEMTAATIAGAPKPDILCDFEWTAGGRKWHATQFSLAPSLAVLGQQSIGESPLSIDDQWLIELKQAIDAVNKTPLSGWHIHPGRVARVIGQRFGSKAPYAVDEWQTAHGDLNWGNVTAPHLMLLDWEFWARPREGSMPPRSRHIRSWIETYIGGSRQYSPKIRIHPQASSPVSIDLRGLSIELKLAFATRASIASPRPKPDAGFASDDLQPLSPP